MDFFLRSRDLDFFYFYYFFKMGFSKKEPIWKTSLIGMLGGVTAAIVGHPFDTIKTRMQSVRILIRTNLFFFKNAKDIRHAARESEVYTTFIYATFIVSRGVTTFTLCTTELDRQFCKFRGSIEIDR